MDVTVNDEVSDWVAGQDQDIIDQYNGKCGDAVNDDLTRWRDVGQGVYDYRVAGLGDLRVVATKNGDDFNVAAIYRHGSNRGKVKVLGATVANYG